MIKKIAIALVALFASLSLGAAPASASASTVATLKTQGYNVKTTAEWDAVKTVLDRPQDRAFAQNLPASPSALAMKTAYDCPENTSTNGVETFCLWNGYSFTGTIWKLPISWLSCCSGPGAVDNGLSFYGSGINNASKAWWNRSYQSATLFDRDDCQFSGSAWYRRLGAGYEAYSLNASTNDWENRISSVSTTSTEGEYCTNSPSF